MLGSASVMAEQLQRLVVDLDDGNPTVEVRIVPDVLAVLQAMRGSFLLMWFYGAGRPGLVYIEGWEGADYLQNGAAISRYAGDFAALWNAAV